MKIYRAKIYGYFVIIILVFLVTSVRFNRQDLFIKNYTDGEFGGDQIHYYELIEVFRENGSIDSVSAPFNSRILPSYIASFLPFSGGISLNILNLVVLTIGFCFSFKSLLDLKVSKKTSLIVTGVHIVSFPVFYYGTIGYIDTILIGILMIGINFLINEKIRYLSVLIFLGVFVKETIFILVFISLLYYYLKKGSAKQMIFIVLSYLTGFIILKIYLSIYTTSSHVWLPSLENFYNNIFRIRTFLAFIVSSIPIFILIYITKLCYNRGRRIKFTALSNEEILSLCMFVGILISYLIFIYSIFSAYADGRFIWLAYPFSIVIMGYLSSGLNFSFFYKFKG